MKPRTATATWRTPSASSRMPTVAGTASSTISTQQLRENSEMAKITRGSSALIDDDRYRYDGKICANSKGWAQADTRQDAPYYGNWVNPLTLELFSYCEGDLTHTQCEDEQDFIATLQEM